MNIRADYEHVPDRCAEPPDEPQWDEADADDDGPFVTVRDQRGRPCYTLDTDRYIEIQRTTGGRITTRP